MRFIVAAVIHYGKNIVRRLKFPPFAMQENTTTNVYSEKLDLVAGPKRKVGLLLAFCGKNYYGLQLNRGDTSLPTIEGALFQALVKAKVVPEICLEKSQQMKYASSSRTDKGVSTCGLVVSLKLRMSDDDTLKLINDHLPPDIRVLGMKRATKSFHAKNHASARTYSYTMPTFAFETTADEKKSYRISEDKLKRINSVLYRYKGTHSYHNFTSGKRMGEKSAERYIMEFWAETPFIHQDFEFITMKVKGQSFMIHQIRKMIGLMIAMVSGRSSEQHFIRAFSEPFEDIPKAPGNGLILEQVHYDWYNKKHGHLHGGMDWSSCADEAQKFMKDHILPVIYKEEIENSSMEKWLEGMVNHDFTGVRPKEQWLEQNTEKQEATKDTCSSDLKPNGAATEKDTNEDQSQEVKEGTAVTDQNELDDIDSVPSKKLKLESG